MKEMIEKAVDFVVKQYQTIRAINSTNQAIRYNHIASHRYANFAEQRAIKANNDTSIEGSTVSDERLQEYMRLIREGKIGGTDIETITNERLRTALEEYRTWYEKAKACQEEVENLNDTIIELYDTLANNPIEKAADAIDKLSTKMDLLDAKLKNIFTTPTYNNKKVNSVYTGNYEKIAQGIIDNYNKQTEELKKASDTANANYTKSVTDLNTKRQSAYSMVSKYGSSAGLTAQQLKNVQNYIKAGKVIPDDYMKLITNQGLYNYLLQYNQAVIAKQEYAEAKTQANADYNQAQEENATAIREVQKDVFDNIEKAYQNQIDRLSAAEEALSAQVSLLEAKGMVVDSNYYSKQIEYEKNKLKYYENEKKALEEQIKNIAKGSDEWYEAKATLEELNEELINANTTIAEMNNSITELANNLQSKLLDRLTRVSDEMNFITGLMENRELINEGSGFTDEGLATLGAYVSGLNTAQIQANSMKQLFENMQKNYSKGKLEFVDSNGVKRSYNSLEQFKEAIDETYTSWQEQIKSVYDFQNDIIDMMTEKYQKELEALKELIEAKKESLKAEKDLRSYQQDVQSSMDNIGSLQKQIQALQGDNSEEGNMRIQKLQKQLEDAQKDLDDKEYDRYISDQEEMLDKMVSEYEDFLNSELKNIEWLLQQGVQVAQQSMDTIANTIEQYAGSYKYDTDSYNLITGLDNINLTEQEIKSLLSEIRDSLKADDTTSSDSSSNKTNSDKSSNNTQTTKPKDKPKDLEDIFKDLKTEVVTEIHDADDKYFTKITDKEPTIKTIDISKMVSNLPNLNSAIKPIVNTGLLNNIKPMSSMQSNNVEATFEFNLPNVTDSKSLLRDIQTDKQLQKALQDITVGQLHGSTSRLSVNKY